MATGNFVLDKGYDAAAQLEIYRACKFSAAETVTPVTAATDVPAGVTQFSVLTAEILKGKGASVRVMGATEMECSAAVAVGALVAMSANGRAKTAVATERVIGVCTGDPSSAAGERIRVQLNLPGYIL